MKAAHFSVALHATGEITSAMIREAIEGACIGDKITVRRDGQALVNDTFAADWLTAGAALHPYTLNLVVRFARALAAKLAAAETKYGYSDGWLSPDWIDECRAQLLKHVAKGDPRDVAAYCAFLWHHGESTAAKDGAAPQASSKGGEACPKTVDGVQLCSNMKGPCLGGCAKANAGASVAWEDTTERYLAEIIDRSPEPLRRLGEWLSQHLDEDDWKTAERYVLGAMESLAAPGAAIAAREQPTDAQIESWAERHSLVRSVDELRVMVEDARTLENAA